MLNHQCDDSTFSWCNGWSSIPPRIEVCFTSTKHSHLLDQMLRMTIWFAKNWMTKRSSLSRNYSNTEKEQKAGIRGQEINFSLGCLTNPKFIFSVNPNSGWVISRKSLRHLWQKLLFSKQYWSSQRLAGGCLIWSSEEQSR